MARFQLVIPHDRAQCIQALEEMLEYDPDLQAQVLYGCRVGDCTGYALLEVSSEEEVRRRIPERLNKKARVVEVDSMNPNETRSTRSRATRAGLPARVTTLPSAEANAARARDRTRHVNCRPRSEAPDGLPMSLRNGSERRGTSRSMVEALRKQEAATRNTLRLPSHER